ncbi:hypothetical protein [Luteimonas saliphila]|nr:hypothetical protein [Luteimonas saliphila]
MSELDIRMRWLALATDAEVDQLFELALEACDATHPTVNSIPTGDHWS